MSDPSYDPDERFSLDDDPEDVFKRLLGADDDEDTFEEPAEDTPT
jgi:hypothetical protein